MYRVKTDDLGRRLKSRRTAAGRTIASVALDAGLSVPYIANLENGRGNPTVAALAAIAEALGATLLVELSDGAPIEVAELPEALVQFAKGPRFGLEMARLAKATGQPEVIARERCLAAMAGMAALPGRPPAELDCHRLLDAIVLLSAAHETT